MSEGQVGVVVVLISTRERQRAAGQRPSVAWRGSGGMAATVATVRRTKADLQKTPWLFSFVLFNFKPAGFLGI